jgi:hypothetical protein
MYFPSPYQDELTGSLVIRASHHIGLTARSMATLLTGKREIARDFPFLIPSALPLLSRACYTDVGHLLWKHTVFPYACIAFDKSRALATESRLKSSASAKLQFRMETIFPRYVAVTPFRRFCDTCCEEELRELGESYWHVSHALPAVAVCARHERVLRICPVRLLERCNTANILPQEATGESAVLNANHDILLAIARESVSALHNDLDLHFCTRSSYRAVGASLGYGPYKGTGTLTGYELARDFEAYFGAALLRDLGISLQPELPVAWPYSLLCGHHSLPQVQLKHVLMRVFLKHKSPGALEASILGSTSA